MNGEPVNPTMPADAARSALRVALARLDVKIALQRIAMAQLRLRIVLKGEPIDDESDLEILVQSACLEIEAQRRENSYLRDLLDAHAEAHEDDDDGGGPDDPY